MMDLSSVLTAFFTMGPTTVTRYAPSTYDSNGRAVAASPSVLSIKGVIVPLSGRELLNAPEGIRASDSRWFFTSTELFTSTQGSQEADLVTVDGESYTVMKKMQYSVLGNFWQYMVQKAGS
jgi:hypothetical protein